MLLWPQQPENNQRGKSQSSTFGKSRENIDYLFELDRLNHLISFSQTSSSEPTQG